MNINIDESIIKDFFYESKMILSFINIYKLEHKNTTIKLISYINGYYNKFYYIYASIYGKEYIDKSLKKLNNFLDNGENDLAYIKKTNKILKNNYSLIRKVFIKMYKDIQYHTKRHERIFFLMNVSHKKNPSWVSNYLCGLEGRKPYNVICGGII